LCDLFGEDDAEVLRVLHFIRDPVAVQLPNRKARGSHNDNDEGATA
jgi:hypothetical protein